MPSQTLMRFPFALSWLCEPGITQIPREAVRLKGKMCAALLARSRPAPPLPRCMSFSKRSTSLSFDFFIIKWHVMVTT